MLALGESAIATLIECTALVNLPAKLMTTRTDLDWRSKRRARERVRASGQRLDRAESARRLARP